MTELTHDTAEEGFHEIQLSGKQIVFLFMAATVVASVIFLTGVLVGRGVRAQRAEAADEPIAAASPSQPVTEAAPAAAEPPAPAAETPDELSYHKRLQGETPPPEQLKPDTPSAPPVQTPPAPSAAAPQPAAAPDVPTAGKPGNWVVQVTALRDAAAAQKQVRDLAAKGFPSFLVNPGAGMPVIYRVQIGGYATRTEAEQIARRLETEQDFKPVVRQR